jgi:hypothetical protein
MNPASVHEHGGDDGQRYGDQGLWTYTRKMGELIGDTAQTREKGLNIFLTILTMYRALSNNRPFRFSLTENPALTAGEAENR